MIQELKRPVKVRRKTNPFWLVIEPRLHDVEMGVRVLNDVDQPRKVLDETAEKLCLITRDIMFGMGDPADYDQACLRRIAEKFRLAEKSILPEGPKASLIQEYKGHISDRADEIAKHLES